MAVDLPLSESSSPNRKFNVTLTVLPRVFFGSIAKGIPDLSLPLVTRDSMFLGLGSNCSPSLAASRPI